MKKILIAIVAIVLVGGAIVFYKVSKRNAENKAQILKSKYGEICIAFLQPELNKGNITKENVMVVCNCVADKEAVNINANKPLGNMQQQITECLKDLNNPR